MLAVDTINGTGLAATSPSPAMSRVRWANKPPAAVSCSRASCITMCLMSTLTIRTDSEVERALEYLTRDGQSRSEAARAAILEAERAHRRARLRAEAEELRDDPEDVAASRELAAEMDAIRAW